MIRFLCALLSLGLSLPLPVPAAQAPPADRAVLPFVAESGVVEDAVPFSEVIRVLGQADRDTTRSLSGSGRHEDLQTLEYPARGLSFQIRRGERYDAQAPAERMVVVAPAAARTPTGLYVGLEESAARTLMATHYRTVNEFRFTTSHSVTLRALSGGRRTLGVSFEAGRVSRLEFMLNDPSWLSHSTRKFLGSLLMCGILMGIGYLFHRFRGKTGYDDYDDEPVLPSWLRYAAVIALLIVGGLAAVFGVATKGDGNGYSVLLALIAMLVGVGCLFVVLALLAGSENRAVSLPAKVLAAAMVLVFVAMKFFA